MLYRGGFLLTTFFSPFPLSGSNHFQHVYTASKEMQSNSTDTQEPMHLLQRVYFISLTPSFCIYIKAQRNLEPCVTFLHQEERARMNSQFKTWLQALAYELLQDLGHPWKATRLMHWLTEFNNALKAKSSLPSSRFIQPPVLFTAVSQDSCLLLTLEF